MNIIIRMTVADHDSYMTSYSRETRDYNEEGDVEHLGMVITRATVSADGSMRPVSRHSHLTVN